MDGEVPEALTLPLIAWIPSLMPLLIRWRNQVRRLSRRERSLRATFFSGASRERMALAYQSSKNSLA